MTWTILQGHVLDRLKALPDESVHCVVTSPPYWSLRDYKTEPQIWGGDPNHRHEWSSVRRSTPKPDRCVAGKDQNGSGVFVGYLPRGSQKAKAARGEALPFGNTCECGAWRGALGLEPTFEMWIDHLVEIFREVRRVLRSDGTLWLNVGDVFAGSWSAQSRGNTTGEITPRLQGSSPLSARQIMEHPRSTLTGSLKDTPGLKPKDLIGLPWRLALALQADGWYLRSDIIYAKPAPMPESVGDRPTRSHEYIFLLAKSPRYFYDAEAIKEPCSPNTHARLSQASLATQRGGSKQDAYRENTDVGKKSRDRAPVDILKAMAENGVGPKAKVGTPGVERQNASFSKATAGLVLRRNKRSVWTIPPEPLKKAHYAAYPTALVEPCILAGTSEYGCCSTCGAPYVRMVEPSEEHAKRLGDWSNETQDESEGRGHFILPDGRRSRQRLQKRTTGAIAEYRTLGWSVDCDCNAGVRPCRVFDPFVGSGTTVLVAVRLGRYGIGIELNPTYAEMARQRIVAEAPLFLRTGDETKDSTRF